MKLYNSLLSIEDCNSVTNRLESNYTWRLFPEAWKTYYRIDTEEIAFPELTRLYIHIFKNKPLWSDKLCFNKMIQGNYIPKHNDRLRYGFLILLKQTGHGGEFFVNDTQVNLKVGDGLVFQAWNQHYTNPQLNGERITFIVWFN